MPARLVKHALMFSAVFIMVWVIVVVYWNYTARMPSAGDIARHREQRPALWMTKAADPAISNERIACSEAEGLLLMRAGDADHCASLGHLGGAPDMTTVALACHLAVRDSRHVLALSVQDARAPTAMPAGPASPPNPAPQAT